MAGYPGGGLDEVKKQVSNRFPTEIRRTSLRKFRAVKHAFLTKLYFFENEIPKNVPVTIAHDNLNADLQAQPAWLSGKDHSFIPSSS